MQTKSNIQIIRENLAVRDALKNKLNAFMDKYLIEDSYFSLSKTVLGEMEENTKGYFVFEHEYNTLDEAISNMAPHHSIRVIDNKRFQIGKIYEKLSEATGDKIIDITSGNTVLQND